MGRKGGLIGKVILSPWKSVIVRNIPQEAHNRERLRVDPQSAAVIDKALLGYYSSILSHTRVRTD
jgi:hypothetical protein